MMYLKHGIVLNNVSQVRCKWSVATETCTQYCYLKHLILQFSQFTWQNLWHVHDGASKLWSTFDHGITIQYNFIAKCQYTDCTRNVLWCQVHTCITTTGCTISCNGKPHTVTSPSSDWSRNVGLNLALVTIGDVIAFGVWPWLRRSNNYVITVCRFP